MNPKDENLILAQLGSLHMQLVIAHLRIDQLEQELKKYKEKEEKE